MWDIFSVALHNISSTRALYACVMSKKLYITLLCAMSLTLLASGQEGDTSRVRFHLSTGATVAAGYGHTQSLVWTAPSVTYRASERLTVSGGLAAAGSLMPAGGYALHGRGERSLAPRREGTKAGALWVNATYHPNDRLWLWGSVAHVTGYVQPLWLDGAVPIEATAISGGVEYALGNGSMIGMHFHFVHDHYGNLLYQPYGHGWYGPYTPSLEIYGGHWPY